MNLVPTCFCGGKLVDGSHGKGNAVKNGLVCPKCGAFFVQSATYYCVGNTLDAAKATVGQVGKMAMYLQSEE